MVKSVLKLLNLFDFLPGETQRELLLATVPIRRVLLVRQAEGTGMSQHHLDQRMRGSASSR